MAEKLDKAAQKNQEMLAALTDALKTREIVQIPPKFAAEMALQIKRQAKCVILVDGSKNYAVCKEYIGKVDSLTALMKK